jgi:hypothetical protein
MLTPDILTRRIWAGSNAPRVEGVRTQKCMKVRYELAAGVCKQEMSTVYARTRAYLPRTRSRAGMCSLAGAYGIARCRTAAGTAESLSQVCCMYTHHQLADKETYEQYERTQAITRWGRRLTHRFLRGTAGLRKACSFGREEGGVGCGCWAGVSVRERTLERRRRVGHR